VTRTRFLIAALTIALTASALANVGLAIAGFRWFRQTNTLRLDPFDLSFYAGATVPPAPEGMRRAVFFGDSRAAAWPDPGIDGFEFVNRGVSYQTTAQILGRFEQDIVPLHPDVVVLELGVNDLKAIPLVPERQDEIVSSCETNISDLVARSNALGAHVVLTTIFSIGDIPVTRRFYMDDGMGDIIRQVNAHLRTLESDQVTILDAGSALDDANGRIRAEYRYDFLHLNPKGYEALQPALKAALASFSAKPPP
jgi:lysophospholipase L1-like esterase